MAEISRALGLPVSCQDSSVSPFALVVAFGRCKFRLNVHSVGLILQATIGGSAALLHVSQLAERTFKFFVSSRQVGFFIVNLRSYSCPLYSLFFHLWGNGGPNWRREFALFIAEEERSWSSKPKRFNYRTSKPMLRARTLQRSPLPALVRPARTFAEAVRSGIPNQSRAHELHANNPSAPPGSGVNAAPAPPLSGANAVPVNTPALAKPAHLHRAPPLLTGANVVPLPPKRSVFRRLQPPREGPTGRERHGLGHVKIFGKTIMQSSPDLDRDLGLLPRHDSFRDKTLHPFCQRCLSQGHHRTSCDYPIRCFSCSRLGHTAANCIRQNLNGERQSTRHGNKRFVTADSKKITPRNLNGAAGPTTTLHRLSGAANPSANDFAGTSSRSSAWAAKGKEPALIARQPSKPTTVHLTHSEPADLALSLTLALGSSSSSSTALTLTDPENPAPVLRCNSPGQGRTSPSPSPADMAYQRADPRPFIPPNFQWVDVPNREFMCRAVAPMRPPPTNEDLAIVTFNPLPGNVLNFGTIRNIVREFLIAHRINPRSILPCHLGQAYVRFNHAYERDQMISESPMVCGNILISFVKHNEGRNWRRVYFNDDCWVMMLGFPDDYKTERHIHNAVSEFGRLLLWEESAAFQEGLWLGLESLVYKGYLSLWCIQTH